MRYYMNPDYQRAKSEAYCLLQEFGLEKPPVNPMDIAKRLGVAVSFVEFEKKLNSISGFYDFEEDTIFVNMNEYPLRQTFTIAHELGHRILHAEWARSSDYKVLMREDTATNDPKEAEANAFAANLLVPRFMLDKYWQGLSASQLSELFVVSVPVIKNRISFEYGA
ncbi:ImmA/IrrE family metallo-endopeptidase [Dyadobacter sp. CY261]|uniref:ImmA/IrrE family metallo-endopeptidase n=1 Tax=Dyadobacter sp. CY261 TaxID=2907203 RepID=UPI001F311725|nr:ImmA/IrrE family metallo-endopeptidase [Dyadobacter sp. CY261]MCF0070694.1 ImmA/IrrE family metallo-endopeptidase [Dyadobacter sp. CY261]